MVLQGECRRPEACAAGPGDYPGRPSEFPGAGVRQPETGVAPSLGISTHSTKSRLGTQQSQAIA